MGLTVVPATTTLLAVPFGTVTVAAVTVVLAAAPAKTEGISANSCGDAVVRAAVTVFLA